MRYCIYYTWFSVSYVVVLFNCSAVCRRLMEPTCVLQSISCAPFPHELSSIRRWSRSKLVVEVQWFPSISFSPSVPGYYCINFVLDSNFWCSTILFTLWYTSRMLAPLAKIPSGPNRYPPHTHTFHFWTRDCEISRVTKGHTIGFLVSEG